MRAIEVAIALLLSSAGLCGFRAAEAPSAARQTLEELFGSLTTAEVPSYFTIRSNLVAHGSSAVPFLETKRRSKDLHERVLAAAAVSWIREAPTNYARTKLLGTLLREALRRRGSQIRWIQSLSFGVWGLKGPVQLQDSLHEDAAVPFLLEVALKGPTPMPEDTLVADMAKNYSVPAKCMAAALAGAYHGPDVLPVLKELLQSPEPGVRACAADGLGKIKTAEVTELLIDALSDPDPAVRETCRGALFDFTDQDFREDRAKWLEWWQQNKQHWPFNDRAPGHNPVPLWTHDK